MSSPPLLRTLKWTGLSQLGKGTFGWVQLAENHEATESDRAKGEHLKAIKLVPRGSRVKMQEVINHSELRHGNIVRFMECFLFEDYLCIAMDYAASGNLWELLETPPQAGSLTQRPHRSSWHLYPFTEDCARWIMQQVVLALEYMHAKQVYNRDLKPHNVLITNCVRHTLADGRVLDGVPVVKLCDFGYSKSGEYASAPTSKVGTPSFMAPEVLSSMRNVPYSGAKVDAWACGVMMFVLLSGELPFTRATEVRTEHIQGILQRIVSRQFVLSFSHAFAHVSPAAIDLLQHLLELNPDQRYDISQISAHPWVQHNMPATVVPWQQRRIKEALESKNHPAILAQRAQIAEICRQGMMRENEARPPPQ